MRIINQAEFTLGAKRINTCFKMGVGVSQAGDIIDGLDTCFFQFLVKWLAMINNMISPQITYPLLALRSGGGGDNRKSGKLFR